MPDVKDGVILNVYPWGTDWPAPENTVNFLGREMNEEVQAGRLPGMNRTMTNHSDLHMRLAPVGSYPANAFGIHDLAGNVSELCQDWWNSAQEGKAVRGGHWITVFQKDCLSSRRGQNTGARGNSIGFRIVLAPTVP